MLVEANSSLSRPPAADGVVFRQRRPQGAVTRVRTGRVQSAAGISQAHARLMMRRIIVCR